MSTPAPHAPELHELERVEWRVLAALRPIDATTGATIETPLLIRGEGARIVRNRSGLHVVHEWTRLAAHGAHFLQPPPGPAPGSQTLQLRIDDPSGRYLPRLAALALPRNPDGDGPDSLFDAVDIALYPAPSARLGTNWCALRVSVSTLPAGTHALGGALLRVVAGGRVLARGLSDWRGEALVAVAGVPVTTWSADAEAVVATHVDAVLEVFHDPALGSRTPMARVRAGHPPAQPPCVDPADLETRRATLPSAQAAVQLRARATLKLTLGLDLP